MLTGKELGQAIKTAIEKKKVTKADVARRFDVKPPSVQEWINRGTISKEKLPGLWSYFQDVVGPEHWGLESFAWPFSPELLEQVTLLAREDTLHLEAAMWAHLRLPTPERLQEALGKTRLPKPPTVISPPAAKPHERKRSA